MHTCFNSMYVTNMKCTMMETLAMSDYAIFFHTEFKTENAKILFCQ